MPASPAPAGCSYEGASGSECTTAWLFTGAQRDKPGRFALAAKGTLFLDEIGEVSAALGSAPPRAAGTSFRYQEHAAATGDLKASDLGTITREDGKKQTTYKGLRSTTSPATRPPATCKDRE